MRFDVNTPRGARYGDTLFATNLVGGEWREARGGGRFVSTNPACPADAVATAPRSTQEDVLDACDAATRAFPGWRSTPMPARGEVIASVGRLLRRHCRELGLLVSREVGKVVPGGLGDVEDAIENADFHAAEAWRPHGLTIPASAPPAECRALRRPYGVVALVTPPNFPVAIPFWKLLPALLAGNTVIWKPSEESPGCAHAIASLFQAAGLPPGVLNVIHGGGAGEAGEFLLSRVEEGWIQKVSFTGSTAVGRRVGEVCGRSVVSHSLELGGKNPFIVMAGTDLDSAVKRAFSAAFANTGQRCTSTGNLLVDRRIYGEFRTLFLERVAGVRLGDPLFAPQVDMGPLLSARYLPRFLEHYQWGRTEGARLLHGRGRVMNDALPQGFQGHPEDGVYVWPTVWEEVDPRGRLAQEEVFGPTVNLLAVEDFDHALHLANGTAYGLTATLLSPDPIHSRRFQEEVRAGMIHINPSGGGGVLPFGGTGASGNGSRELGMWGMEAYSFWQAVSVGTPGYQPPLSPPREPLTSAGDFSRLIPENRREEDLSLMD